MTTFLFYCWAAGTVVVCNGMTSWMVSDPTAGYDGPKHSFVIYITAMWVLIMIWPVTILGLMIASRLRRNQ